MFSWLAQNVVYHRVAFSCVVMAVVLGLFVWVSAELVSISRQAEAIQQWTPAENGAEESHVIITGLVAREIVSGTSQAVLRAATAILSREDSDFLLKDVKVDIVSLEGIVEPGQRIVSSTESSYIEASQGWYNGDSQMLILTGSVFAQTAEGATIYADRLEYDRVAEVIEFQKTLFEFEGVEMNSPIVRTDPGADKNGNEVILQESLGPPVVACLNRDSIKVEA